MMTYNTVIPCAQNPEAWFGYDQNRGRRTPDEEKKIQQAKMLCVTECPLAEQRKCARVALDSDARNGIWAGVELVLHKTLASDRRRKLAGARRQLEIIAATPNRVVIGK